MSANLVQWLSHQTRNQELVSSSTVLNMKTVARHWASHFLSGGGRRQWGISFQWQETKCFQDRKSVDPSNLNNFCRDECYSQAMTSSIVTLKYLIGAGGGWALNSPMLCAKAWKKNNSNGLLNIHYLLIEQIWHCGPKSPLFNFAILRDKGSTSYGTASFHFTLLASFPPLSIRPKMLQKPNKWMSLLGGTLAISLWVFLCCTILMD